MLSSGRPAPVASIAHQSQMAVDTVELGYEGYADYDNGLPVVFSWPLTSETVDPTDFQFTLNTGKIVFGHAAGCWQPVGSICWCARGGCGWPGRLGWR
jgi:hypothetical protein